MNFENQLGSGCLNGALGWSGGARTNRTRHSLAGAAVLSEQAWTDIRRTFGLSLRELQILQGVFDNRKDFAIAAELGISPHTVHTYFERMHRKLGATDRVELVLRIFEKFLATKTASPSHDDSVEVHFDDGFRT